MTATATAVVSARDVTRRYGEGDAAVDALRGITLDIAPGQFAAVMGPSGSGKSTLMHILAGLDKPTEGIVEIAGTDITNLSDSRLTLLRRHQVGFIFQFFNLLPMLTAEENILLPLRLAGENIDPHMGGRDHRPGRPRRPAQAPAVRALRRPAAARRHRPRSGVAPGRDVRRRADRQPRLDDQRRDPHPAARPWSRRYGQTTVMVTHDANAAAMADRVLFLADGRIVRDQGRSEASEVLAAMAEVSAS